MKSQSHRFTNEKLLEILSLSQNATAIYTGEEITIQSANDVMIGFWGKDRSIIGKTLAEAVPELVGQPFLDLLRQVWLTGITYERKDAPTELLVDGKLQWFYFDFSYRAIKSEAGEIDCILHTATDVTELNLGRNLIAHAKEQQEALLREQVLNQELSTANEELAAALEELSATNEELQQTQLTLELLNNNLESRVEERAKKIIDLNQELEAFNEELTSSNEELVSANEELFEGRIHLEKSIEALANSESRTRSIIEAAPFPIGIYEGKEMRITFANKSIMDIWGKGYDVIGKLYSDILPELDNQEIFAQLDHVFTTGIPFEARNQRLDLVVAGEVVTSYFNYNFTPLINEAGEIYGVMNTGADVSDVVLAKIQVEKSAEELAALNEEFAVINEELAAVNEELTAANEEQMIANEQLLLLNEKLKVSQGELNLAIDAAGMATFDLNPSTGKFTGNELIKSWFGLQPEDEIELEKATSVISEADRERVVLAIEEAMDYASGGNYDTYYSIITPQNPEPRIVRAKGKALFNELNQPVRLSGVLQDVTEQITSQDRMKNLIDNLEAINTRFNIALDAGSLGSTEVDLATGRMESTPQFKKCFGRKAEDEFNYPDLFESMLPQYRDKILREVTAARENDTRYKGEYEVMWPDGSIHWINAHGKARYDSDGKAIKMVGIVSDITETKKDEQRKNDFIAMVSHELKTPL
ncbi:MAG: PAS domain-containing protein, partial [Chryseobacterium sp.]